jgi:hypothetical protein
MSDVQLSDADAKKLATQTADAVVERLFEKAADEETVARLASVWSAQLDRHIGKVVRRTVYTFLIGLIVFLGLKIDALLSWFKGH